MPWKRSARGEIVAHIRARDSHFRRELNGSLRIWQAVAEAKTANGRDPQGTIGDDVELRWITKPWRQSLEFDPEIAERDSDGSRRTGLRRPYLWQRDLLTTLEAIGRNLSFKEDREVGQGPFESGGE